MRMRSIHGAAVVFAATLAGTVGSPGPAEAFFFLPILQQSQPSIDSRSGKAPSENNRWRRGDRQRDEAAEPVKPSGGTRAKRDEEKSSAASSGRRGKSQAKSEATSSQASRTRSVRQEPPPSKGSSRASASVRREIPAGGGSTPSATPPATPPVPPSEASANPGAPAPGSTRVGSTIGDTFDEKLGEVFKARIDELIKQSN
jgi:hypothetical protein